MTVHLHILVLHDVFYGNNIRNEGVGKPVGKAVGNEKNYKFNL